VSVVTDEQLISLLDGRFAALTSHFEDQRLSNLESTN
jgi:hypothetical protein